MELLRTPRVVLRRWEDEDLAAYFDIYSRWEVMQWLGAPPRRALVDLAEARQRLTRWRERETGLRAPAGLWALVQTQRNPSAARPVGTLLLLPLYDGAGLTDEMEIGWHLHPDHHHRGLVTEAARALLHTAAAAGIPRVIALTDPDNAPSQGVARRLTMSDEGLTDRWFGITTRQFAWNADGA